VRPARADRDSESFRAVAEHELGDELCFPSVARLRYFFVQRCWKGTGLLRAATVGMAVRGAARFQRARNLSMGEEIFIATTRSRETRRDDSLFSPSIAGRADPPTIPTDPLTCLPPDPPAYSPIDPPAALPELGSSPTDGFRAGSCRPPGPSQELELPAPVRTHPLNYPDDLVLQ